MQKKGVRQSIFLFLVVLIAMPLMTGCLSDSSSKMQPIDESLSPVTTMVESYKDIELPLEMKLDSDQSMALRTDSFKGGISVYTGRVEIASLRDYIMTSMRNNKWKMVGEASYENVMMAFTKPNKTCLVVLSEDALGFLGKTQANFYVTIDVTAANRLNVFGEPQN